MIRRLFWWLVMPGMLAWDGYEVWLSPQRWVVLVPTMVLGMTAGVRLTLWALRDRP